MRHARGREGGLRVFNIVMGTCVLLALIVLFLG